MNPETLNPKPLNPKPGYILLLRIFQSMRSTSGSGLGFRLVGRLGFGFGGGLEW